MNKMVFGWIGDWILCKEKSEWNETQIKNQLKQENNHKQAPYKTGTVKNIK